MLQLESELRTAAELGKHLLDRHDAYVVEIEQERLKFLAATEKQNAFAKVVDDLEANNRLLEQQNEQSMRENLNLLRRLEELNSSLNNADIRNYELCHGLEEAESTIGQLNRKALRTKNLETQIFQAEIDRENLEKDLLNASLHSKQSNAQYKQAEKKILELQEQLERISANHQDIMVDGQSQLERFNGHGQNLMRVFDPPAAVSTMTEPPAHTQELEQGYAILHESNEELRRVLASTQDEVVNLREQLSRPSDRALRDVLDDQRVPRKSISQELHEHHHYHYHIPGHEVKRASKTKESSTNSTHASRFRSKIMSDIKTPVRLVTKNGMLSPPTTQRTNRHDSGYFSFASESGRDRSASLDTPLSPSIEVTDRKSRRTSPSKMKHLRSNSHESVFMANTTSFFDNQIENEAVVTPYSCEKSDIVELGKNAKDVSSCQLPVTRGLRHASSHDSVLSAFGSTTSASLAQSRGAPRRPYASPVQNGASSAVVSMTSATAYNAPAVSSPQESPRTNSYHALRSAAAAQKLSSKASTSPPATASSQFWRRSIDKSMPVTQKPVKTSSRWTSFVPRWSTTQDTQIRSRDTPEDAATSLASALSTDDRSAKTQVVERPTTPPAVLLSGLEEQLLLDALAS